MILGLFWMVVANAAVLLATHAVWRRVRTSDPCIDALLFLILRLLLITGGVLLAGLSGSLTATGLGIGGAIVLLVLAAGREHRHWTRPRLPEVGGLTVAVLGLIGLRFLVQVWFHAPYTGDVLSYHLPKIGEWVQAGGFTREMGLDPCVSFPAGFELIEAWWVVFLHHDVLIELAGVEFAALAFTAVAALGARIGLSPRAAILAGALYLVTPLFNLQVTSCLNDAPAAALVLALAALVFAGAHPLLLLIPLGLAVGLKGTAIYALPGLILLSWLVRKEPRLRPQSIPWTVPMSVLALAAGGYWYIRNVAWFGNPFHPVTGEGLQVGTAFLQAGPSLESLERNLADLVTNKVYDRSAFQSIGYGIAGWGGVGFACGMIGLIQGAREDRKIRWLAAAMTLSLLTVLLMVHHDYWFARFILFFPAVLCIAAVRLSVVSRHATVLVIVAAFLQVAATVLPADIGYRPMADLMGQPVRERSAGLLPGKPVLPTGDPVAIYATRRAMTYFLYGPDFSRRLVYLRVTGASQMEEEMRRRGARYVYVNVVSMSRQWEVDESVRQSRLQYIGPGVYALP